MPAKGTADLMGLKLLSSTLVMLLCAITDTKVGYIGQLENMGSLIVSHSVFIDDWERNCTMIAKSVNFLCSFI